MAPGGSAKCACCAVRGAGMVVREVRRRGARAAAPARLLAGSGRRGRRTGRHAAVLGARRGRRGRHARRMGGVRSLCPSTRRSTRRRDIRHPASYCAYHCRSPSRPPVSISRIRTGELMLFFWINLRLVEEKKHLSFVNFIYLLKYTNIILQL